MSHDGVSYSQRSESLAGHCLVSEWIEAMLIDYGYTPPMTAICST